MCGHVYIVTKLRALRRCRDSMSAPLVALSLRRKFSVRSDSPRMGELLLELLNGLLDAIECTDDPVNVIVTTDPGQDLDDEMLMVLSAALCALLSCKRALYRTPSIMPLALTRACHTPSPQTHSPRPAAARSPAVAARI